MRFESFLTPADRILVLFLVNRAQLPTGERQRAFHLSPPQLLPLHLLRQRPRRPALLPNVCQCNNRHH